MSAKDSRYVNPTEDLSLSFLRSLGTARGFFIGIRTRRCFMANSKILEKKQLVIDEITDKVKNNTSIVLFDYQGITDAEIKELRIKLRNAGADFVGEADMIEKIERL